MYNDDHNPTKYNQICRDNIKNTVKRIKFIMGLTFFSILIASAYPSYVFIKTGKFHTLAGVLIPFVEEGSLLETQLNVIYLVVSSITAGISLFNCQIQTGIIRDVMLVTTNLTIMELEELSEHLVIITYSFWI